MQSFRNGKTSPFIFHAISEAILDTKSRFSSVSEICTGDWEYLVISQTCESSGEQVIWCTGTGETEFDDFLLLFPPEDADSARLAERHLKLFFAENYAPDEAPCTFNEKLNKAVDLLGKKHERYHSGWNPACVLKSCGFLSPKFE